MEATVELKTKTIEVYVHDGNEYSLVTEKGDTKIFMNDKDVLVTNGSTNEVVCKLVFKDYPDVIVPGV